MMPENNKNSLTIGLTESAVFLKTDDGGRNSTDSAPALLRGLLSLELAKPTKISSIQLELQAKAYTSWPEGIGARRIEVSEEHKVYSATNILFRAGPARPASIGPGLDVDNESQPSTPTQENSGIRSRLARAARRVSADASFFQRNPVALHVHDPPIPPYTPLQSPTHAGSQLGDSAQHLEDVRNALRADLESPSSRSISRRPSVERSPSESRGRKKRFSLSAIVDILRSSSPISRGRTMEKQSSPVTETSTPTVKRKSLTLTDGDGWKEFKKGTYTYPISFAIPAHAPPTLACQYGAVTWRLKARVHRPGPFSAKLAASREIVVVASPTEEDTEASDNIIVERLWEQQMQYLISISGRSFHIGGTVPVSFTMMPFTKVKIYRIAVFLEERVDYHTHFKRVARTDPVNRVVLLSLKDDSKDAKPILPLQSDDPDPFKQSPLHVLATPNQDEDEMASNLMGPGPWTFHQDLQLPTSCKMLHFTNKNKRSNITIAHNLKLVIRVQRGDDEAIDEKTGKRKLFDIVIQTPVHILSCRCDPDWTCLPHYSETFQDQDPEIYKPQCPCAVKLLSQRACTPSISRHGSTRSETSDSGESTAETSAVNPVVVPSLRNTEYTLQRSTQWERLVSGQISEVGEEPPAYRDD